MTGVLRPVGRGSARDPAGPLGWSGLAPAAPAMGWPPGPTLLSTPQIAAPVLVDDFNRADSASSIGSAPTGQTWTAVAGTWGISSGKAYLATTTPEASYIATVDHGKANFVISGTFTTSATRCNGGWIIKYKDASNFLLLNWFRPSSGLSNFTLSKIVGGANTDVRWETSPAWLSLSTVYSFRVVYCPDGRVVVERDGIPHFVYPLTAGERTLFDASTTSGMRVYRGTNVYADAGGSRWGDLIVAAL